MIYDCLICGAKRPTSSVIAWKDGNWYGVVCGSHTLREVTMARHKHYEFDLGLNLVVDDGYEEAVRQEMDEH